MNIRAFQLKCQARDSILFPECVDWTPADRLVELIGELGEAANIQKKLKRDYNSVRFEDLEMEAGDAFVSFCLWATGLNVDLETAAIKAYNKVLDRKESDMRRLDDLRREDHS